MFPAYTFVKKIFSLAFIFHEKCFDLKQSYQSQLPAMNDWQWKRSACNFYVLPSMIFCKSIELTKSNTCNRCRLFCTLRTVFQALVDMGIKKSNGGDSRCCKIWRARHSLSLGDVWRRMWQSAELFYREIASQTLCASCLYARRASAAGGKGLNLNTFCAKRDYSAAPISPITLAQSYLLEKESRGWGGGG